MKYSHTIYSTVGMYCTHTVLCVNRSDKIIYPLGHQFWCIHELCARGRWTLRECEGHGGSGRSIQRSVSKKLGGMQGSGNREWGEGRGDIPGEGYVRVQEGHSSESSLLQHSDIIVFQ